ncbi:MAG: adenylate/guanylate cyclase domain-containing protein, partial [Oscillochloris sp.]|nr:adenylate/guanylate cyclase domain-containing protein [Oscillochloris sp.]
SSLGWLWREHRIGMMATAHTHLGYYVHHDLGKGPEKLELNLGSTTDWPMEWRTLQAFVERLRLNTLVPEYRRCVPAFCAFQLPANPGDLHRLVAQMQSVVGRWGGWLNEIEIGDKGAVFVLLFGAPLARGDDTSRAVGCTLELRERGLIRCAAITVGVLFVGPVGSSQRQVYTAQGDDMNLAAHLMQQAAPGEILVSGRVRSDILGRYRTNPVQVIVTKGHSEGVPVARVMAPSSADNPALQRFLPGAIDLIGRNTVRQQALAVIGEAAAAGANCCWLRERNRGIGKVCCCNT